MWHYIIICHYMIISLYAIICIICHYIIMHITQPRDGRSVAGCRPPPSARRCRRTGRAHNLRPKQFYSFKQFDSFSSSVSFITHDGPGGPGPPGLYDGDPAVARRGLSSCCIVLLRCYATQQHAATQYHDAAQCHAAQRNKAGLCHDHATQARPDAPRRARAGCRPSSI